MALPKQTKAARKPAQPGKYSDAQQLERFKKTAREIEVDETPGALDRVFGKVIKRQAPKAPKS